MCEARFGVFLNCCCSWPWKLDIRRRANPAVEGYRRAGANWLPLLCFSFAVCVVAFVCVLLLLLSLSFLVSLVCLRAVHYL